MIDLTLMALLTVAATVGLASIAAAREEAPRMAKEEARVMLERSEVAVIDVRTAHDWKASDSKIRGAVRENPDNVGSWADKYQKDQTLLLY